MMVDLLSAQSGGIENHPGLGYVYHMKKIHQKQAANGAPKFIQGSRLAQKSKVRGSLLKVAFQGSLRYPETRSVVLLVANYLFFLSRFACFFSLAVFWGFFLSLFLASFPFDI
jgi:hypothetical protein